MIDLNNPDSYTIQDFGGGAILYRDSSTGLSYDPNDLTTPLSTSEVAAYGAQAGSGGAISPGGGTLSTQSSYNAPAPSPTTNSASSGGMNMAGLSGMFTAVGSAFASLINPPKTTKGGQPLVYDAARMSYVPASAVGQSVTNISSIPMWLVLGIVAIALVLVFAAERRKRA
jgi:hypothetical protein